MARRFIVDNKDIYFINDEEFIIFGDEVKHIQVLRFNVDYEIQINNKICKIIEMKRDSIKLKIISNAPDFGIPNVDLTLFVAMLKGDKMDLVIQKAVELGVKSIVPFISRNVIVKLDEKSILKKQQKYQKIADEACKQCGRTDKVNVFKIVNFDDILQDIVEYDKCFFAYENSKNDLRQNFNDIRDNKLNKISCVIGPEGGFDKTEVDKINKLNNILNISLGKRILRAETAVIYLCTVIMYELDR